MKASLKAMLEEHMIDFLAKIAQVGYEGASGIICDTFYLKNQPIA